MKGFLNEHGYPLDLMKLDSSLWGNIESKRQIKQCIEK